MQEGRGAPHSPHASPLQPRQPTLPGPAALARSFGQSLSTWVTGRVAPGQRLGQGCHVLKAPFVWAFHSRDLRFSESPPWMAWRCHLGAEVQRALVRCPGQSCPRGQWEAGSCLSQRGGTDTTPGLMGSPSTGQRQFWCHSPASGCPLRPPRGGGLAAESRRWGSQHGHRHGRPADPLRCRQRGLPLPEASHRAPPRVRTPSSGAPGGARSCHDLQCFPRWPAGQARDGPYPGWQAAHSHSPQRPAHAAARGGLGTQASTACCPPGFLPACSHGPSSSGLC